MPVYSSIGPNTFIVSSFLGHSACKSSQDFKNLKKELAGHTHKFKGIVTGTSPSGPIAGTAKGTTVKSIKLASAIGRSMPKTTKISTSLSSLEKNYSVLMKNYLNSNSPTKIRSSFNKVN